MISSYAAGRWEVGAAILEQCKTPGKAAFSVRLSKIVSPSGHRFNTDGTHLSPAGMQHFALLLGVREQNKVQMALGMQLRRVWSLNYILARKVLTRAGENAGQVPDPLRKSMALRKFRLNLQHE